MAETRIRPGQYAPMFDRVLICGVGLMGGSLGLALRRHGLAATVVGWDRSAATLAEAVRRGVIDAACPAPDATGADLVIIATPVAATAAVLTALAASLAPDTIVTDVGSVKGLTVNAAPGILPAGVTFIGGHPMAGKETSGIAAATADLFAGATWVLCPAGSSPDDPAASCSPAAATALAKLESLIRQLGAVPTVMAATAHDEQVAAVSHLPQVASSALMLAAQSLLHDDPAGYALAAGGWRDMTRLAASNAEMWRDICLANRPALLAALTEYAAQLTRFATAVAAADGEALATLFAVAQQAKAQTVAETVVTDIHKEAAS